MRAPDFWHRDTFVSRMLTPLSAVWTWGARHHQNAADPYRPAVPVICVGNIISGGAGKTPVAIALAERLVERGRHPHILTRGYGGTEAGPRAVDLDRHTAARVGDEALLLARHAPTWVARWRPDGAMAATSLGADILIMDDGFQNTTLSKDLSLIVIDGGYGFGNGRVIPAGPCREPIAEGLARADAAVLIGEDRTGVTERVQQAGLPLLHAELRPGPESEALRDHPVIAFAGIGRPAKFFATLEECGARIVEEHAFPDHHPFTAAELADLAAIAQDAQATLITTAKDAVRLPQDLRGNIMVLNVTLAWRDPNQLDALLDRVDSRL